MARTMDGVTFMVGPVPGFTGGPGAPTSLPDTSSSGDSGILSQTPNSQSTTLNGSITGSPTAITIMSTIQASSTQSTTVGSASPGGLSTTTLIAILIPITILLTSVPIIFYTWSQRRKRRRRRTQETESIKHELETSERDVEIDGTEKRELEARVWVQELGGQTIQPERKELETVEKPQELEARRKSQLSGRSKSSRKTLWGFR